MINIIMNQSIITDKALQEMATGLHEAHGFPDGKYAVFVTNQGVFSTGGMTKLPLGTNAIVEIGPADTGPRVRARVYNDSTAWDRQPDVPMDVEQCADCGMFDPDHTPTCPANQVPPQEVPLKPSASTHDLDKGPSREAALATRVGQLEIQLNLLEDTVANMMETIRESASNNPRVHPTLVCDECGDDKLVEDKNHSGWYRCQCGCLYDYGPQPALRLPKPALTAVSLAVGGDGWIYNRENYSEDEWDDILNRDTRLIPEGTPVSEARKICRQLGVHEHDLMLELEDESPQVIEPQFGGPIDR